MKNKKIKSYFKDTVRCCECDEPISEARLKILPKTTICVSCMEDFENRDRISKIRESRPDIRGTVRHKMEIEVASIGEEVEKIEFHILRSTR